MVVVKMVDNAVHISDGGEPIVIKDAATAKGISRAMVQYLRDKGIESQVSAGREISFSNLQ